ncbi:DsrE family protein [Allosphingosinicella flava]|uniref:DsrE family protein n=2 Tax=Allosphingosinicella flava TaxID=2771430 RepID=A0A7T2LNJ0_9SPHN|nr:DsrE family protein [Sphingosinicella flava]QPQ56242.1 DsrE family protein [Sphingosinicella flava]
MRPLTVIVAGPDPARFHAALSLAAAAAALDRPVRLFLQAEAVALLRAPIAAPGDAAYAKAGMPVLAALLEEAQALGVAVTACQSGLALAEMTAAALPPEVDTGGLIEALAGHPEIAVF